MSHNDRLETEMITEYISSIRNMIDTNRRTFSEYIQSVSQLNTSMYHILELYLVLTHRNNDNQSSPSDIIQPRNYRINARTNDTRTNDTRTNYTRTPYTRTNYTNINTASNTNTNRSTSSTPIQSYFTPTRRNSQSSTRTENIPNRPRNFWHFPERRTTPSTGAPRRVRQTGRERTRRQTFLQQILQTSLYTPTMRRPASIRDISRNTQLFLWREIQNETSQLRCPITLETFQPGDRVLRITNCGHIFHQDALNTYLNDYDHRCPICRYNISSDFSSSRTNATTNTSSTSAPSTSAPSTSAPSTSATSTSAPSTSAPSTSTTYVSPTNNINTLPGNNRNAAQSIWGFTNTNNSTNTTTNTSTNTNPTSLYRTSSFFDTDLSRNFPEFNFTNTIEPQTFNLNLTDNNITEAINEISSVMMSSLNSALSNPDNSGNTISAEYSLFVPTFTTTTTENYEDEDNVE